MHAVTSPLHANSSSRDGPGAAIYQQLRARLNTLLHASDILRTAVPADPLALSIHHAGEAMGREIEALRLTPTPPPEDEIHLLKARIDHVEQAVLALDATVPMILFRRRIEPDLFPSSVVEGYLELLARHMKGEPERRDRFDLLMTALCSTAVPGGQRKLRSRPEVETLLDRISGGHRAHPVRCATALAFFKKARWKMARLSDPEKIFKSGLYANIYGLKLALREDFLDPTLLHAVAALNITLGNLIASHSAPATATATARALEEMTRKILSSSQPCIEMARTSRFEKARADGRLSMDDAACRQAWRAVRKQRHFRLAAAAVLLLALGSTYLDLPKRPPRTGLSAQQIGALSDLLGHGDVVGASGEEMLDAIVDAFAWDRLEPAQRKAEAEALARQLVRQTRLQAAFIRREEGPLVILIQEGKVVFVL